MIMIYDNLINFLYKIYSIHMQCINIITTNLLQNVIEKYQYYREIITESVFTFEENITLNADEVLF